MSKKNIQPFLWNHIKNIQDNTKQSGGQERPLTETIAEENRIKYVEFF